MSYLVSNIVYVKGVSDRIGKTRNPPAFVACGTENAKKRNSAATGAEDVADVVVCRADY
jgi:hypothetical protein